MHDKTHLNNKIINNLKFFKVYKIVLSKNYKNIILYDNDTAVNNLTVPNLRYLQYLITTV